MRTAAALLALLIVTAGCSAPFVDDGATTDAPETANETSTATDGSDGNGTDAGGYDVPVQNGSLDVDADAAYARACSPSSAPTSNRARSRSGT
ncbi:hypothetical protein G9464_08065 [Halostella sp. JP-L12]|uniref:hypothetical protein n=1 Tax=Halostella TaxID=1843185 RepID=UPI000EF7FA63|nr:MULTISPECIES: hypothetical protein [Halostella]NHN47550.1 hypothetical protein [Halostella sp. JP-L12]